MRTAARTSTSKTPKMFDATVRGKKAWTKDSIQKSDYLIPIPETCQMELKRFAATLRDNPLQIEMILPNDYALHKTKAFMACVRKRLETGVGFAILDRLSVKTFNKDDLKAIYWILSSLIARPVAQSFSGTLMYDVIDTGKIKSPKVRADVTSAELDFHTDYSYNYPPRYFGLQALRTAKKGGRSGAVSLMTAHNEMRQRYPLLLKRLYRPFWLNRYGEHAPDLPKTSFHPVYTYDNSELWARFNPRNIYAGYELAQETLDTEAQESIEALNGILSEPKMHKNFYLAAGQIIYFHNGHCAHNRTAYEDFDEPDKRRHMIRIFLRNQGARTYNG
jgi:alpha-ketoglutarate-dependent taurine dioxygenase